MKLISTKKVILDTKSEKQTLELFNFEKFSDNSGYRCDLKIASYPFICEKHDLFIDNEHFDVFLEKIRKMYDQLDGQAELMYRYEQDEIIFSMNKKGQLKITGKIFAYSEFQQSLDFIFVTDQTALIEFISNLSDVYEDLKV